MPGKAKPDQSLPGDRVFAGLLSLLFAGQFVVALGYPPEPRLFPLFVCGIGAVLALTVALGAGTQEARSNAGGQRTGRMVLAFASPPAYGLALWLIGYWIATLVSIPAIAVLLGYRRPWPLVLVTVGMTAAVGFVFPVLNITLPVGRLVDGLF